MTGQSEAFGDSRLSPPCLQPARSEEKRLTGLTLLGIALAAGTAPSFYAFGAGRLSLAGALLCTSAGVCLAVGLSLVLARGGRRYGIGAVPLARAAFGPRGAVLPLLLRFLAGIAWGAWFLAETSAWAARLFIAAIPPLGQVRIEALGLEAHVILGVPLAALLIASAWVVARGGYGRIAKVACFAALAAALVGAALIVFGGIASKGFGEPLGPAGGAGWQAYADGVSEAFLLCLPATLASGDWLRLRATERGRRERWTARLSLLGAVPLAWALVFAGTLAARASMVLRGHFDGSPIADAAGFGGLAGGGVASLLAVMLWLVVSPLVVLEVPQSALAAATLGRLARRGALFITALMLLVATALVAALSGRGVLATSLAMAAGAALAGILGILLADELLWRRGRVVLEDLYLFRSKYGPTAGFAVGGLVALVIAAVLHPWSLRLAQELSLSLAPSLASAVQSVPLAGSWASGLPAIVLAGAVFLLLRPLDHGVAWLRGFGRAPKKAGVPASAKSSRQSRAARSRVALETEVTSPHFVWGEGGVQKMEAGETKTKAES